jgi:hypothetical protein
MIPCTIWTECCLLFYDILSVLQNVSSILYTFEYYTSVCSLCSSFTIVTKHELLFFLVFRIPDSGRSLKDPVILSLPLIFEICYIWVRYKTPL